MNVPQAIIELVERFEENLASYTSGNYNEAQLRREFIDPLFRALGWDLDNVAGHAEAYKDVVHEDAIRIGGAVKAPDYCFRIGGTCVGGGEEEETSLTGRITTQRVARYTPQAALRRH